MSELFKILPDIILYLTSGCLFIYSFYFLIDRRFDFFSEISFTIMLIIGFVNVNLLESLSKIQFISPILSPLPSNVKKLLLLIASIIEGVIFALIRNKFGSEIDKLIIKCGRHRTSSESFWYYILDEKDKPMWIRLISYKKGTILEGILMTISESEDNPYLLLSYCTKFDIDGHVLQDEYCNNASVQTIVRPDMFDEIIIIYAENSSKPINLTIN